MRDEKTMQPPVAAPVVMTISGDLGAGKSLLTGALVERWGARRYSTGTVQRQMAEKLGITTLELNRRAETDHTIDDQIDSIFRNLSESKENLVVDSRMAFHFLPESFRIKLEVHPKVAAIRIQKDTSRIGEGPYNSPEEIEQGILARKTSERERFKRYYNVDIEDHAGYTVVVNTTCVPADVVNDTVNTCMDLWKSGRLDEKLWISPQHLYVPAGPETIDPAKIEHCRKNWPQPGAWPAGAVTATKLGPYYVVTTGAEWVAAGLKDARPMLPVRVTGQKTELPGQDVTQAWEQAFGYTHIS